MDNANKVRTNDGTIIQVKNDTIDNLMIAALEMGISQWCKDIKVNGEYLSQYASEQIARDGSLLLYCRNKNFGCYLLTKELFLLGIKIVFKEYNHTKANWFKKLGPGVYEINSNSHSPVLADLIIQCGLFGKPVFDKNKGY